MIRRTRKSHFYKNCKTTIKRSVMGAFTAAESNNQIEAENSSHQALKRAWEQLSYRIRYDKSKTIRARCDTAGLEKKQTGFKDKTHIPG